jgi:hypothetical protein
VDTEKIKFKELQEIFAEHFSRDDVEGAKRWIHKWYNQDNLIVLGHETNCGYTVRAMSGHVSDYLEGYNGTEPESYNFGDKIYGDTKYGSVMYDAIFNYST